MEGLDAIGLLDYCVDLEGESICNWITCRHSRLLSSSRVQLEVLINNIFLWTPCHFYSCTCLGLGWMSRWCSGLWT